MRKRILVLTLAVGLILSACGKKETEAQGPSGQLGKDPSVNTQPATNPTPDDQNTEPETPDPEPVDTFEPATDGAMYDYAYSDGAFYAFDEYMEYLFITSPGYESLKGSIEAYNQAVYTTKEQFEDEAYEEYFGDDYWEHPYEERWQYSTYAFVMRSDSKIFSFRDMVYVNMDEFGSYRWQNGYNFEAATGMPLALHEVVSDMKLAEDAFIKELSTLPETDWDGCNYFFNGWQELARGSFASESVRWAMGKDNLLIWLNEGEITSDDVDGAYVVLTYEDYPEVFNVDYLAYRTPDENMCTDTYEDPDYAYQCVTDLYRDVVVALAPNIGAIGHYEMVDFVKNLGYRYEVTDPGEPEMDCDCQIWDNATNDRLWLMCWPDADGEMVLYSIWYYRGNHRMIIDNNYHEGENRYQIIDDRIYEAMQVANLDAATAAMFLFLEP